MEKPLKTAPLLFLIVAATAVIFFNKYIIKDMSIFYPRFFRNFFVVIWEKSGNIRTAAAELKKWRKLAEENEALKQKNNELANLTVLVDELENENKFLKKTLNFIPTINKDVAYGNVFNLSLTPAGYSLLLNKGADSGIVEGETVINEEGILIGQIQQVFKDFSKILFVADPNFKINARILGTDTAGIAKGSLKDGLKFDLIVQSDQIKEGDTVVSSGNDMFPSALIIGTVSHIESSETQIFKKVKIMPAVSKIKMGRVLILKSP